MSLPKTVQPGKPKLPEPPSGWSQSPLGDHLTEIRRPAKLADDDTYSLVTVKRARGGVVKRADMTGKEISVKSQFYLEPDDFLVSKRQIVHGACGVVPKELAGSIVSNEYSVFKCRGTFDLDFLKYLSHSVYFQQTCFHSSIGVHVEKLIFKVDQWLNWNFNVPPLAEQKKIAKVLFTWDAAIETTQKMIGTAENQKKALMQQLLTGRKRMGGHSGEWAVRKLSEFCEVRRGASPRPISSTKWFADEGRGWVRISDVTSSQTERLEATTQYLSEEGISKSVSVDPGDLIMSICATIGVPKFLGIPACIHDGFVVFREINNELDPRFLYFVLESATEKLASAGQPGTQKNLNTTIVGNILVPAISLDEQIKISEVLRAADDEVRGLKKQYASLIEQKHSLMQQLLTGKNRVKLDGGA